MTTTMIDEKASTVVVRDGNGERSFPFASAEAFAAVSNAWLRVGWDAKHVYSFTWMGRPIIQLPEDLVRMQEVLFTLKPDVVVETGIAHGGSLIFYASLFEAMGHGRVVGIDVDIRPHNRAAIEAHLMKKRIAMVEGSSVAPEVVSQIKAMIRPREKVLVILDSNHSYQHVLAECRAYADLVSIGSYIVATDGIMQQVVGAPRSAPDWDHNNPQQAARDFVIEDERFAIEEPAWVFNEGVAKERVTYWPEAFIKRMR